MKMVSTKKGAMFGLDARIALAIFGALSVISGAALYSAIQSSKTTALLAFFEEFSKSTTQYYLDTGEILYNLSMLNSFQSGNLYTNYEDINGWNGPYFGDGSTGENFLTSNYIYKLTGSSYLRDGGLGAYKYTGSTWTGVNTDFGTACVVGDCYMYLILRGGASNTDNATNELVGDLALKLDQLVDGGDGSRAGKLRYTYDSAAETKSSVIYYKAMPFNFKG
jgi:type II secretory pathway pseudopilin PulG